MQIQKNISLKPYNTFGIDIKAESFSAFSSVEALKELAAGQTPFILGGGSNVLFTKNIEGLVLKNELKGIELAKEDDNYYYIKAWSGEVWNDLVQYTLGHNYAGLENLSLIPGSVGASPMQNIGAYGVEIKDVFYKLEAFHLLSGTIKTFSLQECEFGYRESVFKRKLKDQFVILNVTYRLPKVPVYNTSYGAIEQELQKMNIQKLSAKTISQAVINIRTSKLPDPKVIGNAGSFFKNPQISKFRWHVIWEQYPAVVAHKTDDMHYKIAAGWLIEQCGWKGFRKGDAGCHNKQALVLVNYGKATGADILALSEDIIQSVKGKFGIVLEREVNII